MIHSLVKKIIYNKNIISKIFFSFGMPSSFLRNSQRSNTEIVSLTNQQMRQLATIKHYQSSVQKLSKNNLRESLNYLQYALADVKIAFPYSVNLQACLMNRMSILLKLLNNTAQFQARLQQLYMISLSAKGSTSLDTIKSLINYLICLMIHHPEKGQGVIQFLRQDGLPQELNFFQGLTMIRMKKQFNEGIEKLSQLPEKSAAEKVFKWNNLAFMRMHCIKQEDPINYLSLLKKKMDQLLSLLIRCLIEAENSPEDMSESSNEQRLSNQQLQAQLNQYLNRQRKELFIDNLVPRPTLKNTNSHIICMNIASLLFDCGRVDQSYFFLQLSLDKAVKDNQLERVGVAMILLSRHLHQKGDDKWQGVILDVLNHASIYPKTVIKQALDVYSRICYQRGRMYEAEGYYNQASSISIVSGLEGLILPSYDFSY